MPWNLTTVVATGDLAGSDYAQVKITQFRQDSNRDRMGIHLEYGNTVDGDWVTGHTPPGKQSHVPITDAEYAAIIADSVPDVQTSDPADSNYAQVGAVWVEKTYYAAKRGLYEWLETNSYIDAGVVI